MNLRSSDLIGLNAHYKEKERQRKNCWDKIFDKYELAEDDSDTIDVKDIAKVYPKESRKRRRVNKGETGEKSDVPMTGRKRGRKVQVVHNLDQEGIHADTPRTKGGPKQQNSVNIKVEIDAEEDSKTGEIIANKSGTARKRGRPCSKTNIKTEVEIDQEGVNGNVSEINSENVKRKRGRPCIKRIKVENETDESLGVQVKNESGENVMPAKREENVMPAKRGRPALKKNIGECSSSTSAGSIGEDLAGKRIKQETIEEAKSSPGKRSWACLDDNRTDVQNLAAQKNKSSTYAMYIIHPFCRKELEMEYPSLVAKETKLFRSRTFTSRSDFNTTSPTKASSGNKTFTWFSDNASKQMPLHSRTAKKENCDPHEKNKSSKNFLHKTSSRKMSLRNKSLNNCSEKVSKELQPGGENRSCGAYETKSESTFNMPEFDNKLQSALDPDLLRTKYIIEEKLKSDFGYMVFKRHQSQKLASEKKQNNYAYWHSAVTKELLKLLKVLPKEKLENYMYWAITTWMSQPNRSGNCMAVPSVKVNEVRGNSRN